MGTDSKEFCSENFRPKAFSPRILKYIYKLNFKISYLESMESSVKVVEYGEALGEFDFSGKTSNQLSFSKGDLLTLIRKVDENWYEARINNNQKVSKHVILTLSANLRTDIAQKDLLYSLSQQRRD